MNYLYALVLFISALVSFHVQAEVTLHLGEGVRIHAVDGKSYSNQELLSGRPRLTLDDGVHQIVVDYQVEVGRGNDDGVIDHSSAFVILFNAEDKALTLSAPPVSTRRELASFNDNPGWILHDDIGKDHEFHMDVLDISGFQLVRDYEEELSEFNKSQSKAALRRVNADISESEAVTESLPQVQSSNDQVMVRKMLRYWYMKADDQTKSEMKRWINSGY
ncbi:DUF2057 family protein [Marinobacter lacisalsi]|uniref:UPF0319 protein ACFOZ5_16860 n=1 Tax=Marinobacter lacisalsi TaxID=475979 RepID=A0ABV8QLM7_9GAMM